MDDSWQCSACGEYVSKHIDHESVCPGSPDDRCQALEEKVEQLEERIESLEGRLRMLEPLP